MVKPNKLINPTPQNNGLDGKWRREDGLTIEVKGENAYFVLFGASTWKDIANTGLVSVGDLKWTNINDDIVDRVNGLPYKCPHNDKETIDENKHVVRMTKSILTAF